jgi:hypothetical protein
LENNKITQKMTEQQKSENAKTKIVRTEKPEQQQKIERSIKNRNKNYKNKKINQKSKEFL